MRGVARDENNDDWTNEVAGREDNDDGMTGVAEGDNNA